MKADQIQYKTPKNHEKQKYFFKIFNFLFPKRCAWLSTPTPRSHNVLIVSERAIAPAKPKIQKYKTR